MSEDISFLSTVASVSTRAIPFHGALQIACPMQVEVTGEQEEAKRSAAERDRDDVTRSGAIYMVNASQ
jgi:hypothetical protein